MQAHRSVRIGENLGYPRIGGGNLDPEFFADFAHQSLANRLTGLNLAAWKFPVPCIDLFDRALGEQKGAIRPQHHRNGDIHGGRCAQRCGFFAGWRPDQSRANWKAMRPEREPRLIDHCSASNRAASVGLQPKLPSQ